MAECSPVLDPKQLKDFKLQVEALLKDTREGVWARREFDGHVREGAFDWGVQHTDLVGAGVSPIARGIFALFRRHKGPFHRPRGGTFEGATGGS